MYFLFVLFIYALDNTLKTAGRSSQQIILIKCTVKLPQWLRTTCTLRQGIKFTILIEQNVFITVWPIGVSWRKYLRILSIIFDVKTISLHKMLITCLQLFFQMTNSTKSWFYVHFLTFPINTIRCRILRRCLRNSPRIWRRERIVGNFFRPPITISVPTRYDSVSAEAWRLNVFLIIG